MNVDLKSDVPTTNQAGLAELLNVDRTTIRAYAMAGMPCVDGGRGKENRYPVPLCLYWFVGFQAAREHRLPGMMPLEYILYGHSSAFRDSPFSQWRNEAMKLATKAGGTAAEAVETIGYLRGARLLPWQ